MACSHCGTESTIAAAVPDDYREYAPESAAEVTICPHCLTVDPAPPAATDARDDGDDPDFSRISGAFPARPARAVPLALALHLCGSLATNRDAIETLLRAVEREGTDPLLVIDRLAAEPTIEPAVDLERRRHQLEQLLY
ncbi:DUF6276 family protein [Halosolutus halophilus]|uniref:DUF6276 family protein n=1 Tax=Halosolutus halophilus TaxID=1552990 RepID=UPI002234F353|nr:DUF6276 family protein [Halosolutus halophilus]